MEHAFPLHSKICWVFLPMALLFALHISFVSSPVSYTSSYPFIPSLSLSLSLSRTRAVKDWLVSRSYQPGTNDLFANALCDIFSFYLHKRQHWLPSSFVLLIYLGGDFQFLRRRCSKINYMLIYGVVLLWFASRSIMVCYKDTIRIL